MTDRVKKALSDLNSKEYRKRRTKEGFFNVPVKIPDEEYISYFEKKLENDFPLLYDYDDFGFNLGVHQGIGGGGGGGNVIPNYGRIIGDGFDKVKEQIMESMSKTDDDKKIAFGKDMLYCIDLCLKVSDRYKAYAKECGNTKLYDALCKIPRSGAETLYEALVFMKMSIYFLRSNFMYHLCLGRFDMYMYPYYKAEKERGTSDEEILELLEMFYIAISRDTDLYAGVQQGDNGQSMVLGGFDENGNSMYNELSKLCMQASLDLCIIEPKINLRVGKNTPSEIFEFATLLTKKALGFPQYCNDDVVVPGLMKLGYSKEDAYNYAVAACWEYIIPNCGADIPNINVMDFPLVVSKAVKEIKSCNTFDELMAQVEQYIKDDCDFFIKDRYGARNNPRPLLSVYFDGCIDSLCDVWHGGTKYYNFGCHGTGIANGADALAAVKKCIYEDKSISKDDLLCALENDFRGYENVRRTLLSCPKMGCNDEYVDSIANRLMDVFSKNLNNRPNGVGGIWRAGTGSAMEYIFKGRECPATADGRRKGEPYSSSFSPSLGVKPDGLLSVLQSFTSYDMTNIINGGPLTIEIHDSVLRNDMGIKKTAMLVKTFIELGGHQLQLNSLDKETLKDAQAHPEKYPNLVVRVWGWSGYFNELDKEFQNHILERLEYTA